MGFGACFPRKEMDELWGPTIQKGARAASSLLPEADAVTAVLTAVRKDQDLAIGTDSATVLFAIKRAAKTDFADWSAIKRHPCHMGPLVEALALRTGTTFLFKLRLMGIEATKGMSGRMSWPTRGDKRFAIRNR
jgi:hypothetical protein